MFNYNNEKFIVIEDDLLKELTNFISNQLHNIFSNEESNKIFDKEFDNIFQIFKRIDEDIITKKTIINIEDKEIEEYNDKTIMQLNEIIFSIIDSLHNFNISTNTEVNNRISYVTRKLRDYFKGFITLKEELFNELSSMISFDLYEVFNTNTFSDELFDSFVSIFKKIDKYNSEIRLLKSI